MSGRRRLTPHQRIMRAAERGTGCRLSYDDVQFLASDDAIVTRALVDDERDEARVSGDDPAHAEKEFGR